MNLSEMLINEEKRLNSIKKKVDKSLKGAPDGTLQVKTSKRQRCYVLHKTDDNGVKTTRYVRMKEAQLLKSLAQRDYDKQVQKLVDLRLRQLKRLAEDYRDDEIDSIFEELCESRQCLVKPVEPTKRQKTEVWRAERFEGKDFYFDTPEIYTKRGERVRSKSEKIIADMLADANLAYRYEYPLYLDGMGEVHPDFTVLHPMTMKEVYWEHCGLMNDPDYSAGALRKIECYMKNGFFPGEGLILTFEGNGTGLDVRTIKKMIEVYFLS